MDRKFIKTVRRFPEEREALRVWLVEPEKTYANPKTGLTHSARWYATRADGAPWMLCTGWPARPASEDEASVFDALPMSNDVDVDLARFQGPGLNA